MIFVIAWINLLIWAWLLLGHGRFWLSGPALTSTPSTQRQLKVTVVVPARDEADHVEETLRSLLAQNFEGDLRVVLVYDNSTDATADVARKIMEGDRRLRVVTGEPLKPGWTGKMWTVSQGLKQVEALEADYVLLTDADVFHGPEHLAALAAKAEQEQLDLVSEMVRLRCESFAERATIPAFVFFFQMLYPFRWVGNPKRGTAAAAGGTMLLSRKALDRIEGVERISGELIDDVALAREIKRGGHRIWLGHADAAVSERRYPRFEDVWEMIARTAYVQLGYSPWMLMGTFVGLLLVYVEPVLVTLFAAGTVRWFGVTCWLMMAVAFQPTLRRYRCSPAWGPALPAIALFYLLATLTSAIRFHQGKGGRWKSRVYPAA